MSTAVDTAFEEIVSNGVPAEYRHAICGICHPNHDDLPVEVVTLCGQRMTDTEWLAGRRPGSPKHSECLTIPLGLWPCGH